MSYTASWKDIATIQADAAESLIQVLDSDLAAGLGDTFKSVKLLLTLAQAVTSTPKTFTAELHHTLREALLTSISRSLPSRENVRDLTVVEVKAITTDLKAGQSSVAQDVVEPLLLDTYSLHDHKYVLELSRLAANVLAQAGFNQRDIERAIERARWELNSEFTRLILERADRLPHLVEHLKLRDTLGSRFEADLLRYRMELSKLGGEPIFDETFGIDRLFVDLHVSVYRPDVPEKERWERCAEKLMPTVLSALDDLQRVIFIEGGPGTGKSSFCKLLASRLARDNSTPYYPLFIRLRDPAVKPSVDNFQEMFEKALADKGFSIDTEFLRKRRFLFILDGFDELVMSGGTRVNLRNFFYSLMKFQEKCAGGGTWQHKIVVTGRPMAIENPVQDVPESFQRLRIEPLDQKQLLEWLGNWGKVRGQQAAQRLKRALEQGGCLGKPKDRASKNTGEGLQIIARQTLLLYLIAKLDEDGHLTPELIQSEHPTTLYKAVVDWICGRTGDRQDWRNLTREDQKSLRRGLQVAGLAIFQSGREHVGMDRVRAALKGDSKVLSFLEHGGTALLASFYFTEAAGAVEFSHKSFGEYLAAEAMLETLKKIGRTDDGEYLLELETAARHWYATFGGRALTKEVALMLRDLMLEAFPDAQSEARQTLASRLIALDDQLLDEEWLNRGVVQRSRDDHLGVGIRTLDINAHSALLHCTGWLIAAGAEDSPRAPGWLEKALHYSEGKLLDEASFARRKLAGSRVGSRVIRSNLSGADFSGAVLGGVVFDFSRLDGANFANAKIRFGSSGSIFVGRRGIVSPGGGGFNSCILKNTNFSKAGLSVLAVCACRMQLCDFEGARIYGCTLWEVDFAGSRLRMSWVEGTIFDSCNFDGCDLSYAQFSEGGLLNCTFEAARLEGTEFRKVDATGSPLTPDILQGSRWGAFTCPLGVPSTDSCDCPLHTYIATHPEAMLSKASSDPNSVPPDPQK